MRGFVVFQVRQLALFKLAVEGQPLQVKFGRQRIKLGIDRLPQEGDVHLRKRVGLFLHRNQLVGEMTVLQTVVEVEFARLEAFPDLAVQPEFVAISVQAR
ncbi:hypothetical protein ALO53_200077 [Pseudomonas amygdali pv. photiniae]|uniref:Uncharacterized protein n=1 Tax=Pseudomonas amygdali pv. photiniae TaxID=251724 RepID=A0A0P9THZ8_PSEA0|nr:hypothetical protein ALO53_200077 [Pseudomonas amygdali pv. photiniae]